MSSREEVVRALEPLIRQAELEGKFLVCSYQGITFSPKELRVQNANGKFCWGPTNWALVDPQALLRDPQKAAAEVEKHNEDIRQRMRP